MKLFECQNCGQILYFHNTRCEQCGHVLGYLSSEASLGALIPAGEVWERLGVPGLRYRFCANHAYGACNWLVPDGGPAPFCTACRLNRVIPNLEDPENIRLWCRLEDAKHRLVYSLLQLGLPVFSRVEDPENGLTFDFPAPAPEEFRDSAGDRTGHLNGVITINLAEADDAERERQRKTMAEPYRTILGHFRHESGHYYWERLIRDTPLLDEFRVLFGDERGDYGQALADYYRDGPRPEWNQSYVTAYASSHPWEDWAETWSHYLHIFDTLETAHAFGLRVTPRTETGRVKPPEIDFNAYTADDLDSLVAAWLPLTYALNSLNRSMGHGDLYPFVLVPPVIDKLRFIHRLVHRNQSPPPAL